MTILPITPDNSPAHDIEAVRTGLAESGYICDARLATAVYLSRTLAKPLLVEGPPGVGKTELAHAASGLFERPLIRLQCYEGLDESRALYEWKYGKQLLYTQLLKDRLNDMIGDTKDFKASLERIHSFDDIFFNESFLEPRPLLRALKEPDGAVLLVDEIDKADDEFEAFLLEILSAYQISIPEIGTVKAQTPPLVFLTSNGTRDIGDALRRRCLHLYIPFPDADLERRIIEVRVPGASEILRSMIVAFVQTLREQDLKKPPSVSETLDWARALILLNAPVLDADVVRNTLNVLLKVQTDMEHIGGAVEKLTRLAKEQVAKTAP
ncbi:MAG: MoxR family ATPase [Parvularculales bacterium]